MRPVRASMHLSLLIVLLAMPAFGLARSKPIIDPAQGPSATSTLVKNINTDPHTISAPTNMAPLKMIGGLLYFMNEDPNNGHELWVTDGTSTGTRLLRDINPGTQDTLLTTIVDANGTAFFMSSRATLRHNTAVLWASDGTTAGTRPLTDVLPWQEERLVDQLLPFTRGNQAFFLARAATDGISSLWSSTGTEAGTIELKNFGSPAAVVGDAGSLNGMNYFFVSMAGVHSLWRTDGTAAGTNQVTNLTGQPGGGIIEGDQIVFLMNNALWRTDGTAAGTQQVASLPTRSVAYSFYQGYLYYREFDEVPPQDPMGVPATHTFLQRMNVTTGSPALVYDFGPRIVSITMAVLGDRLFFTDNAGQLWSTTGSTTAPIATTSGQNLYTDLQQASLISRGAALPDGQIIIAATQDSSSPADDLWSINPTSGVATLVRLYTTNQGIGPQYFTRLGTAVVFIAFEQNQLRLWKTDGTDQGTIALTTTIREQGLDGSSQLRELIRLEGVGERVIFQPTTPISVTTWWSSTGSAAETQPFFETPALGYGGNRTTFISWNNGLYVIIKRNDGIGVWKTDGTTAGTIPLKIFPTTQHVSGFVSNASAFYFIEGTPGASDMSPAYRLWRSDGTSIGTTLAVNLPSKFEWFDQGEPRFMGMAGNTIFFNARTDVGRELWVTNGTQAGTTLVKDLSSDPYRNLFASYSIVGNRLFFMEGIGGNYGYSLWVSDGTAAGTQLLKAFDAFPIGISPLFIPIVGVGSTAYFAGWDNTTWLELWKSDGTPAGTTMVKDINIRPAPHQPDGANGPSYPRHMVVWNGKLLFYADDGVHGDELWISDGTNAGTTMVKDINPGSYGSEGLYLTVLGDHAYFSASDGPSGVEVWRTDGTTAGTVQLSESAPGPDSSNPNSFTLVGNTLFFIADDGTTGMELHKLSLVPEVSVYRIAIPRVSR